MKNNIGSTDKVVRYIIAIVFIALFFTNYVQGTLGKVLVVLAMVLLITNFISFCPLYKVLGITTNKKNKP